ncbi:alanine--tRNA ligase, partial [Candidatus Bipolaricaulota bacterium]|nr:alanine--tRNA ligase [Candidatus Bipolaricaulota bacterium]
MKASDLRTRYLEFFAARDHMKLPSSPLVPNDPTLLFTSAGMVQFKDYFAGRAAAPYPRVTTCQKCFRTTDIENVGKTAFHHTFFEMLGNFSFGDYFKEGAINLAWEFLTRELAIDPTKLWVTVYQEDDEAYDIWHDVMGVPSERMMRLGKKHNWWGPVGNAGPCGPDSEIHFDTGIEHGCGRPDCEGPACDCNRFSEIWNLVFMQYEAQEDGTLVPLKRKNIDTGMGLERMTTTLQGASTNFETDLFCSVVEAIEAASPRTLSQGDTIYRNTIADHIRAVLFLLSEGLMPSNERQGYVLRRILRRAIRAGEQLELAPGSLATFVEPVIETMGAIYPEIMDSRKLAHRLITREEETFRRTLRDGERRLAKMLDDLEASGERTLPGEAVFELNDTYGFPLEMTQEIAGDRGFSVEILSYEKALEQQRARSRVSIETSTSVRADPTVI